MNQVEFPVKYFHNNLIFNQDGSCWAYYEAYGIPYEFRGDDDKNTLFMRQLGLFWNFDEEKHLLMIPVYQNFQEKADEFKGTISGELKELAIYHTDDVVHELERKFGKNAVEYRYFIGVKLKVRHIQEGLKEMLYTAFHTFKNTAEQFGLLGDTKILKTDLEMFKREASAFKNKIRKHLAVRALETNETQWVILRNFYRTLEAPVTAGWTPPVQNDDSAIIPNQESLLRLSEAEFDVKGRHIEMSQIGTDGLEYPAYMSFLSASKIPYTMEFPDQEWMYMIQNIDFPIELSVRTENINHRKALSKLNKKKKDLEDQEAHARENAQTVGLNVYEGVQEATELQALIQKTRMPLVKTSVSFCICAEDLDTMRRNTNSLISIYREMMIELVRPYGDQFLLFNEFIPGSRRYVNDYIHFMEPGVLAAGMFGATQDLGDNIGFYIGTTGILNKAVYMTPSLAATNTVANQKTSALSVAVTGSTGSGKSFGTNLIVYLAVLGGAQTLIVDPKGERGNWTEDLHGLEGKVNVITLGTDRRDEGKLDPFIIHKHSRKDAIELAMTILTFITGIKPDNSEKFPRLASAVEFVAGMEEPCLTAVSQYLEDSEDKVDQQLAAHIQAFENLSFAHLIFGDGTNRDIELDTAVNIIQIQHLDMPDIQKDPKDYTLQENLSVSMLMSLSSFARKFFQKDPTKFKIVLLDEAWAIMGTSQGRELARKLVREGRALNSAVYFATQSASDLGDETFKNNIGMKFSFRNTDSKEISSILDFFGLPDNEENHAIITNLETGQCLFQDIQGRTGVVTMDVVFKDLYDAFDTRPNARKNYRKSNDDERQEVNATFVEEGGEKINVGVS
ncbi:putative ATP/GTP-binding protein (plasmid) [Bacillus thuringiensis MC28]|nr:putative ATP/GTP-binding protein [Bacillus thuringiensis MC28]